MPSTSTRTVPQPLAPIAVGTGVTLCYPQDRYGYVVVGVSASGKTAQVVRLFTPDKTTGHEPSRYDGPFPVWDHRYTEAELAAAVRAHQAQPGPTTAIRLNRRGEWQMAGGAPVVATHARYLRNYSY